MEQRIRERDAESYLEAYIDGDSTRYQLEATAASSALTILVSGLAERDDLRILLETLDRKRTATKLEIAALRSELRAVREVLGASYGDDLIPLVERIRMLAHAAGLRYGLDGWEFDAAENEAANLRRQLAECQAENEMLRRVAKLPPQPCGDRGFAGYSACHLPAGHEGPHEYRTYVEDHEEQARRLSARR